MKTATERRNLSVLLSSRIPYNSATESVTTNTPTIERDQIDLKLGIRLLSQEIMGSKANGHQANQA